MISQEKWKILTPSQNLPRNVGDLGKLIAAKGFKKLPKVQKIAKSGHTDPHPSLCLQVFIIQSFNCNWNWLGPIQDLNLIHLDVWDEWGSVKS